MTTNFISESKRHFHLFCIGLPRSGTHSIANLFRKNYKADHEPFPSATVKLLMEIYKNNRDSEKIINHLIIKDRILQLELEAAHYLHRLIPELVALFPESKFILTVREPSSWLESEINQNYQSVRGKIWAKLEEARYNRYNFDYESEELKNFKGVYPISSYLHYYIEHIDLVLNNVPSERLLILDTFNLQSSVDKLCAFTGAEKTKLNFSKIHSSKRSDKLIQLKDYVPENVLNKKIDDICRAYVHDNLPLLKKYM